MSTPSVTTEIPFVGRQRELDALREAFRAAEQGTGQFVLIGGEAGIGKSTLLGQFLRVAREAGASVLAGASYDLETTPPYGPWREALAALDPQAGACPELDAIRDPATNAALGGQEQLIQVADQFLAAIAAGGPAVLVFEDAHWSDLASLELLRIVLRRLPGARLLILCTYRDDELAPTQPLARLLSLFVRESRPLRLSLRPLDAEKISEITAIRYPLEAVDAGRLAEYLLAHGEGNPFFTVELLETLVARGVLEEVGGTWRLGDLRNLDVPPLIRQVIDSRLGYVSPATRSVLDAACVLGADAPLELLAAIAGIDEPLLEDAVAEAGLAHFIIPGSGGASLRFRHALIRQAVYEALSPVTRTRLHHETAKLLAARPGAEALTVAHHFRAARDLAAIPWLVRAGRRAQSLYAHAEAIDHFTMSIDLAASLGLDSPIEAIHARGVSHARTGDFEPAAADLTHVLRQAENIADRSLQWQATMELGELWTARDYQQAGVYFDQAIAIARTGGDDEQLASSLQWVATWHLNSGRPQQAIAIHEEALALAEQRGDRETIASITSVLAMDHLIAGDLPGIIQPARRASGLLQTLDDQMEYASSLVPLAASGGAYMFATENPADPASTDFIAVGDRAVELAVEANWPAGGALTRTTLASVLGMRGCYDRALPEGRQALHIATEIDHPQWVTLAQIHLGELLLDLLAPEQAIALLEPAVDHAMRTSSMLHLRFATSALARALIAGGMLERAGVLLAGEPLELAGAESVSDRCIWRARAEFQLAISEPAAALEIVESLIAGSPNSDARHSPPHLELMRGNVLAGCGRSSDALDAANRALALANRHGFRPLAWRVQRLRAGLLLGQRQTAAGNQAHQTADEIALQLAATIPDPELRAGFEAGALRSRRATGNAFGLTDRELEVLRLAANGMTNVAIAGQLFIGARTVKGHLESVYNKLGVDSRTAAATKALEEGML
jgi:ATP/maltotriose-dependent transcriptional regulator MalT